MRVHFLAVLALRTSGIHSKHSSLDSTIREIGRTGRGTDLHAGARSVAWRRPRPGGGHGPIRRRRRPPLHTGVAVRRLRPIGRPHSHPRVRLPVAWRRRPPEPRLLLRWVVPTTHRTTQKYETPYKLHHSSCSVQGGSYDEVVVGKKTRHISNGWGLRLILNCTAR